MTPFRSELRVTCQRALLAGLDLDTSAIYWSMLDTGLGFVAAILVIVYGLLAQQIGLISSEPRLNAVLQVLPGGEPRG